MKKNCQLFGKHAEKYHLESFRRLGSDGESVFIELFRGLPEIDLILKEGDIVPETDLKVIHTPGHSAGSICLYSESKKILFSGDTLFCEGVGRTDLDGGNPEDLKRSIQEKTLYPSFLKLEYFPPWPTNEPGKGAEVQSVYRMI